VTDKEAAYPDREWLCFVESAADRNGAEAAAMNALAQSFRVDIRSATEDNQTLVSQIRRNGKQSIGESAEYRQFTQNLGAFSSVSGLIGVEKEFWTARDGTVYANVRMNRAECSARYQSAIEENESLINLIRKRAEAAAGGFETLANLSFAETVAELTDNFYTVRSVLQPETIGQRPLYGGAGEIRLLKQEISGQIVIAVKVNGDVDDRISKAFSTVFSEQGYLTGGEGTEAPYTHTLRADFKLEDEQADRRYKYARFTLNGALTDRRGAEILAFTENDREGHLLQEGAQERAVQGAESYIMEGGFAEKFDAYLDSLL
jgi:hypothetical protein